MEKRSGEEERMGVKSGGKRDEREEDRGKWIEQVRGEGESGEEEDEESQE